MCSFTKHEGRWAVRSDKQLEPGSEVEVTRRSGETQKVKVGPMVKHWPKGKYPESFIHTIVDEAENGEQEIPLGKDSTVILVSPTGRKLKVVVDEGDYLKVEAV